MCRRRSFSRGSPARRRPAHDDGAQFGDDGCEIEAARHSGERPLVGVARHELVEKSRRLLVVAAHRGHDKFGAGAGDGDVEQPALFGQPSGDRLRPPDLAVVADRGEHVDELLRSEQRAATADVGPAALLHARDDDDVPLETLGGVRGQELHAVDVRSLRGERVARNLLAEHVVEEDRRARFRQPVGEARGHVEQGDNCVEVAVGGGRAWARRTTRAWLNPVAIAAACHIAHSTDSAVDDGSARAVAPLASMRAMRLRRRGNLVVDRHQVGGRHATRWPAAIQMPDRHRWQARACAALGATAAMPAGRRHRADPSPTPARARHHLERPDRDGR